MFSCWVFFFFWCYCSLSNQPLHLLPLWCKPAVVSPGVWGREEVLRVLQVPSSIPCPGWNSRVSEAPRFSEFPAPLNRTAALFVVVFCLHKCKHLACPATEFFLPSFFYLLPKLLFLSAQQDDKIWSHFLFGSFQRGTFISNVALT